MAKPDLDDGWLKYAHELDAALAVGGFTKGARIVLKEVFAQIFGPAKAKAANVWPSHIAGRAGAKRELIARALKELVDARVLVPVEGGLYRFNKDYETWLEADGRKAPSGASRLSSAEVSYCRHAPAVALAYANGLGASERNQVVTTTVTNGLRSGGESVTNGLQNRNQVVTQNVTNGLQGSESPPDPPYVNAPAEFENRELSRCRTTGGGAGAGSGTGTPAKTTMNDLIVEARKLHGEAVARDVTYNAGEILGAFGNEGLGFYLSAIRQGAKTRKTIDFPHPWFMSTAKRFRDQGSQSGPAAIAPKASPLAERTKAQDDAFARAAAELDD